MASKKYEKPIYMSGVEVYAARIVAPIKAGTRIRVKSEYPVLHGREYFEGVLEYRVWIEGSICPLHPGVRYGPAETDWELIIHCTEWEVL